MKKNTKLENVYLLLILAIAAFFRLYQLGSLPVSLFGDEVDVGYHAWSLWTTGRDYMGHLLPTYIQSLAESRAPLLMYLSAPFVGILGPSAISVRLGSSLMGILNIYLVYLLVKNLFKNAPRTSHLALIASFLLTITPWHLYFSRAAFEVTLLLSLLLGGTILYLKQKYSWSYALFALTFYTYSTANIFTPLLVLSLLVIYPQKISNIFKNSVPALILVIPIAYQILFGQAGSRFGLVSIFNDPKAVENVIIARTEPWVEQGIVESTFHNRYLNYLSAFEKNYLTAFSPQFLFLSGDPRFRHSVGNRGELLWPLVIPLLLSLFYLFKNLESKEVKLILSWLLLAPIAASLTISGGDHSTRLFVMLVPLVILVSLGLSQIKNRLLLAGFSLVLLFSYTSFWHYYSGHYRYLAAKEWHYGYKEIFTKLKDVQNNFKYIFVNNTYQPSLLLYSFYTQLPPKDFQKMFKGDKVIDGVYPEFNGFLFGDNIYFGESIGPYVIDHITKDNGVYLSVQGREAPGNWDWIKDSPGGTKPIGGVYSFFKEPLFHLLVHMNSPILKENQK